MHKSESPSKKYEKPAKIPAGRGNLWEYNLWKSSHPRLYSPLKAFARTGSNIKIPGVGLIVSDAALLRETLMNPIYSKIGKGASSTLWNPITGPTALINMDGADHLALRRKLGPIFSPRAISELSSSIMDESLEDLQTRLLAGKDIDIVQEVSKVAGSMICALTGIDPSDEAVASAVHRAHELTSQASLKGTLTEAQAKRSKELLSGLTDPVREAYHRGDEKTVPGKMKVLGLSEEEAIGASSAFIIAGTETVITFIPRIVAMIIESGWLERLTKEPERMGDVINEGLRMTVPTPVMLRSVTQDTVLGGKKVKKGERVIMLTMLACQRLENGNEFNPDRPIPESIGQIWFGAGSHFCIGMPLAMAQTKAFLNTLIEAQKKGPVSIVSRSAVENSLAPGYRSLTIKKGN